MIQLSSCGAYESVNCLSIECNVNENTSESPKSKYESTKIEAVNLIAAFAKNMIGSNIQLLVLQLFLVLVSVVH